MSSVLSKSLESTLGCDSSDNLEEMLHSELALESTDADRAGEGASTLEPNAIFELRRSGEPSLASAMRCMYCSTASCSFFGSGVAERDEERLSGVP